MTTAAVLLAAGEGARFTKSGGESHKLLAPFMGWHVIGWSMLSAVSAKLDAVYVVVGSVDIPEIDGVTLVRHRGWAAGASSSLRAGVRVASREGHTAVVVGMGDQPLVVGESWRQVARSDGPISVATYDGLRGHPVKLSRRVWPLLPERGEGAAALLMRRRPDLVTEVACDGHPADIDTPGDLSRWG